MQILPIQRSTLQRGIQGRFALARLTQHRAASFRSVGIIDGDAPSWLEVTHSLGHEWQALLALLAWQLSVSDDCANSIPEQPRLQSLEGSNSRVVRSTKGIRIEKLGGLFAAVTLGDVQLLHCRAESSPRWPPRPSAPQHIGRLPSSASKSARTALQFSHTGARNHCAALLPSCFERILSA